MKITPTALRKDLFKLLDQVLESGEPIIIKRKSRELMIFEKKRKDIYEIMDDRQSALIAQGNLTREPNQILKTKNLNGLDSSWENDWNKKWDEWLEEK